MIFYGFQRLALLNAAGYQRAELPLDAAVSLVAPNNAGKTSLINALQFLLIIDRRRMDFGAHDVDASRRFYFPHNSAYVLLEVSLPAIGTVVLGCVGKGVSHDYEYFAYRGELDLEDYCLPDGSTVAQPRLREHMAGFGRPVYFYSSAEFAEALYGGRRRRAEHEPDFTVFKLERVSNAATFQKVLTRTLRLDRLSSAEVKAYLLEIFRDDLPDASIDFKAEWDKAFAEVNADRAQYDAALKHRAQIREMEGDHGQRRLLRGKVLHYRPQIDARLVEWDAYQRDEQARLSSELARLDREESQLQQRDRDLITEKSQLAQQVTKLESSEARLAELARTFSLVHERRVLEQRLAEARDAYDAQATIVLQASGSSVERITREIGETNRQRATLTRELETLSDNLFLRLTEALDADSLQRLNCALAPAAMTLAPDCFALDPAALRQWLDSAEPNALPLPGLSLALASLSPGHEQRSREELQEHLRQLETRATELDRQLEAAKALDAARARKNDLDALRRRIESELQAFDEMTALQASQAERVAEIARHGVRTGEIDHLLDHARDERNALREARHTLDRQRSELDGKHRMIVSLRGRRGDDAALFDQLPDLPYQAWIGSDAVALPELADALQTYQQDCRSLLQLDDRIHGRVAALHSGGLTKFQFSESPEQEVEHLIGFAAHLPQEAEALERKARTAVVNVTACLRELRDGLDSFKSRMNQFNRLIGRRHLSDLEVFKIEPVDETALVDAVQQLIGTAEQASSGETFALFDHQSVLDDAALNRAKALLIEEGAARGCLRVEHFFRLEFIVGKSGRKPESFADIDSAASNGTVLMAKLVTGLALLHQMKDKRHDVQAVCYLDEASALDQRNQTSLIDTAREFGFALVFASPAPLITARYCVPITSRGGHNLISRRAWQIIEPLDAAESA
ncbi:MAG: hypothetical protein KDG55_17470 [Rhodocyclaceae bacterium]|nr:hypothetical protein [Rhodocyclaceae bacterium]